MSYSYPECPTMNISTTRSPASYKILLRLEHYDILDLDLKNMRTTLMDSK